MSARPALLKVRRLSVRFGTPQGELVAVDELSFSLESGETLCIAGESGSGKSSACRALMRLVPSPPGRVSAESLCFEGQELLQLAERELCLLRGARIALISQDALSALNPYLTIGAQLGEVLDTHQALPRRETRARCVAALGEVGIPEPERRLAAHPHELSGGQRQRVLIAMALLCRPRLLLADEPTTALDASLQAQVLELLRDLQRRHGMGLVLVTHSLGVAAAMADKLLVMYAGRAVESGPAERVYAEPLHPYTRGLLACVPRLDGPLEAALPSIPGQPPDMTRLPGGCAFASRCGWADERCLRERPEMESLRLEREPDAFAGCEVACFEALARAHERRGRTFGRGLRLLGEERP